jgi:hypothetical protein
MRSNMLIRSAPFHLALTRNVRAVVAVNWASATARHRVLKRWRTIAKMQFPLVNRFTPIQETGGADSYRVPDRRRVLKLGATSLVMPFLLGRV